MNLYLKLNQLSHLKQKVPNPERIHRDTITKEQINQLLIYARKQNVMDYIILRFITDFDCRPHEILKTRWIDIHGDKIYFNDNKTGNTIGYLAEDLQTELEAYRQTQTIKGEYIFINQQGRYKGLVCSLNGWAVRNLVKTISQKVIGRILRPQDLRSSVMTEEFNSYINPEVIRLKARHRDIKTTLRYNHAGEKQVQEYINQGTIFSDDNQLLFKPTSKKSLNNWLHIDTKPQENLLIMDEEDGNGSFSFSIFLGSLFDGLEKVLAAKIFHSFYFPSSIFIGLPEPNQNQLESIEVA
jgi:hypothetical protein